MRLAHYALLIPLLLACGAKQPAPPAETSPPTEQPASGGVTPFDVGDLKFAWPAPGRVTVVEEALKKGKRGRMQYTLEIAPADDKLHVSYRDFRFLEIDGVDVNDPANAAQVAQLEALSSAIPTLVISGQGELIDLIGFDEMIERMLEQMLRTVPPDKQAQLRAMLTSDALRAGMAEKAADPWRSWVEMWTHGELPTAGTSEEYEEEDGTPIRIDNRGLQVDGTLRLEMRRTKQVAPEELELLIGEVGEVLRDRGVKMRLISHSWVETTRTLQPRRVHLEATIEMDGPDGKRIDVRSNDYTFAW